MKKFGKMIFVLAVIFLVSCESDDRIKVKILSQEDASIQHDFKAELAFTPQERAQGLMYRQELGKDEGMLFIFSELVQTAFWMKNTLIPLDIIFIDQQKHILSMVENAAPQTLTPREPAGPYQYVLEIAGGRAQSLGIKVGDEVSFQLPSK